MKRAVVFLLSCLICFGFVVLPVQAKSVNLDDLLEADEQIKTLEVKNNDLSEEIEEISVKIQENESRIEELTATFNQSKKNFDQRLRVMYIFNNADYLIEMLFSSESMSDFFAKADNIISIIRQDSSELSALKKMRTEIESKKKENETHLATVQQQKDETEKNLATIKVLVAQRKETLEKEKAVAAAYAAAQIEKEKEEGRKNKVVASEKTTETSSENKKSEASSSPEKKEEPKQPEPKKPESTPTKTGGYATQKIKAADFDTICAIVAHEGGTSYEGSMGVISCVMNRCDVGWGGYDPLSVLTAPYQFESYFGGYYKMYMGAAIPETRQAVRDCVEGGVRSHDFLSFRGYYIEGARNICGNYYFYPKSQY